MKPNRVISVDTSLPLGTIGRLLDYYNPNPPADLAHDLKALRKSVAGHGRPFQFAHVQVLLGSFLVLWSIIVLVWVGAIVVAERWGHLQLVEALRSLQLWEEIVIFGGVAFMPGGVILFRGLRRFNSNAERVLRETGQRPILYLRPFHTDSWTTAALASPDAEPFDVIIARSFRPYGPVVSIARPGEARRGRHADDRAVEGMSREYYSDAAWKDAVMSRIEQALLIVVVAGHTAGLQWELEQLLRSGSLSKTIVVRGPIKDTKPAGALLLQDTLRLLPDIAKLVQAEQLVGVVGVYINKIGELVLLRSERERAADYQRAMAYAVHGILCT